MLFSIKRQIGLMSKIIFLFVFFFFFFLAFPPLHTLYFDFDFICDLLPIRVCLSFWSFAHKNAFWQTFSSSCCSFECMWWIWRPHCAGSFAPYCLGCHSTVVLCIFCICLIIVRPLFVFVHLHHHWLVNLLSLHHRHLRQWWWLSCRILVHSLLTTFYLQSGLTWVCFVCFWFSYSFLLSSLPRSSIRL